ncbi:MAG: hypothetical protein CM15mP71_0040 [Candidatus Poseidoniales archaeon]|nr:MAG: hypothetical protein CM15mP71_0040 [Candidatus Poseidoniales archaeon]
MRLRATLPISHLEQAGELSKSNLEVDKEYNHYKFMRNDGMLKRDVNFLIEIVDLSDKDPNWPDYSLRRFSIS